MLVGFDMSCLEYFVQIDEGSKTDTVYWLKIVSEAASSTGICHHQDSS